MNKTCSVCQTVFPGEKSQCPSCKNWNVALATKGNDGTVTLDKVVSAERDRLITGPWDYCWGGGIVRTSVTMLGGLPGAGKSTLLLQLAMCFCEAEPERECMYIATEEAEEEIKLRADRLEIIHQPRIRIVPAMSGMANVGESLMVHRPGFIILDSLQGMAGEDHATILELLKVLKKVSKTLKAPSIVISHVNKAGDYAGLMTYQHAVDVLLTLAPDEDDGQRELFVRKNRFGRAFINLYFDMTDTGLVVAERAAYDDEEDEED